MCKKANSILYRLNYFRKCTSFRLRKYLNKTLLFSVVDYCSLVYIDISDELNLKLQCVVNYDIRYVCGVRKSEHISPYRRSLGWLTTSRRRAYFAVSLLFKIFKTGVPPYLLSRYQWNQPVRPQREDVRPLTIPSSRTSFLDGSYFISSSKWNDVTLSIRTSHSLSTFKTRISSHYLSLEDELAPLLQSHL